MTTCINRLSDTSGIGGKAAEKNWTMSCHGDDASKFQYPQNRRAENSKIFSGCLRALSFAAATSFVKIPSRSVGKKCVVPQRTAPNGPQGALLQMPGWIFQHRARAGRIPPHSPRDNGTALGGRREVVQWHVVRYLATATNDGKAWCDKHVAGFRAESVCMTLARARTKVCNISRGCRLDNWHDGNPLVRSLDDVRRIISIEYLTVWAQSKNDTSTVCPCTTPIPVKSAQHVENCL